MRRQYHVRRGLARSWADTVTRKIVPLAARGSKKWAIEGARLRHARLLGTALMFRIATLAAVVLVNTAPACHASTTECAQATELAAALCSLGHSYPPFARCFAQPRSLSPLQQIL